MDNPNPDKVATVAEIAAKMEQAGAVLVTEYRGLNVPAQAQLRAAVKDAGGEYKIYKNTLTRIAAARTGVAIEEHLSGPTALAFAFGHDGARADSVALSKALVDFAKTNPSLVVRGGVVDGALVGAADVTTLAQLPPREEMLARFAGLLAAPMTRFAGLLQALPQNFAGLLKALIDKGGGGAGAGVAPAPVQDDVVDAPAAATDQADAAPAEDAPEAASDAVAATEDAVTDTVSDLTEEPAAAGSEDTDDKED